MRSPYDDGSEYLGHAELAERLGVSTDSVRRWHRTGQLASTRIGHRWRVSRDQFESYVRAINTPRQQTTAR